MAKINPKDFKLVLDDTLALNKIKKVDDAYIIKAVDSLLIKNQREVLNLKLELKDFLFLALDSNDGPVYVSIKAEVKTPTKIIILITGNNEVIIKNNFNVLNNLEVIVFGFTEDYFKLDSVYAHKVINANTKIYISSINSKGKIHLYNTKMIHEVKHTESEINAFGIVKHKSESVFINEGKIEENAVKTIINQNTKGLILDEGSTIEAKPVLYIDENDVIANHGAAVGAIDERLIYYLTSRGIKDREARKMIIFSYIDMVLDLIESEKIKNLITKNLEKII